MMPWRIVLAACVGMFAATSTGSTRSPFLPDIAFDLAVSLPAVANLFGFTAAAWGISSYLTGYASDRMGRRGFLIIAPLLLCVAMLAVAVVDSYSSLVLITIFGGLCCGACTASSMAEVSLQSPASYQGRALGFVMAGQSLTLLVGVPLSAWLGAKIGWRGIHVALAMLALVAAIAMFVALATKGNSSGDERTLDSEAGAHLKPDAKRVLTGPVIRLFIALVAERVCFGLATFYYASFLRTEYGAPIESVAVPLIGFALGNLSGTFVGGLVADKIPYRRVCFAVAIVIAGCVAVPWFAWTPGMNITIALGVAFAFFDGLSRPALMAALADVPREFRGLIMGLNSSIASIGWLTAALVGGWLYAGVGFAGFSPLMAGMCVVAAAVVLPDTRLRLPFGS